MLGVSGVEPSGGFGPADIAFHFAVKTRALARLDAVQPCQGQPAGVSAARADGRDVIQAEIAARSCSAALLQRSGSSTGGRRHERSGAEKRHSRQPKERPADRRATR